VHNNVEGLSGKVVPEFIKVANIYLKKVKIRLAKMLADILLFDPHIVKRVKIVDDSDAVSAFKKVIHKVASDKSSPSCNKYFPFSVHQHDLLIGTITISSAKLPVLIKKVLS